jgi:hypothetical protein
MRTVDEDVLIAKAIARQRNQTVGKVVSGLVRKSLRPPAASGERHSMPFPPFRKVRGVRSSAHSHSIVRSRLRRWMQGTSRHTRCLNNIPLPPNYCGHGRGACRIFLPESF